MFTSHNKIKYLCNIMFRIGMHTDSLSGVYISYYIVYIYPYSNNSMKILGRGLWHVSPNSSGTLLSLIVILQLQRTLARKNYMWQNGIAGHYDYTVHKYLFHRYNHVFTFWVTLARRNLFSLKGRR